MGYSGNEFSQAIQIEPVSLNRIKKQEVLPSEETIEKIYNFAYKNNIQLNKLKEMFYKEETKKNNVILFHGSKNGIKGNINLKQSRGTNDFGPGFYLGESMEQTITFVSRFPKSSAYIFSFNTQNLKSIKFNVDRDWMLTIAYFRQRLNHFKDSEQLQRLILQLDDIDYIIAPIADNRMFQIINTFIDAEITDEQCKHCLAATNLGFQYVLKSEKAINHLMLLEQCYLCNDEKQYYRDLKESLDLLGQDKVKIARREYRGKGKYIEEIL